MINRDPFDLNALALTSEQFAELAPLQKAEAKTKVRKTRPPVRRTGRFVQLPYERTMTAAGRIKCIPLAVLTELSFRLFKANQETVPLANKALRAVGVSRWAKDRALRELEAAGLVSVIRRGHGRSPLVTLLWDNSNT
jgi:hypothetical protein